MNPTPRRRLALQAYDGWDIPNSIDPDPTPGLVALAKESHRFAVAAAKAELGPPTGRYNCHGLVFASRRTNIPPINMPNAVDIDELLRRDQYERVEPPPRVGDVVVYRGPQEIEHTGLVSWVDTVSSSGTLLRMPVVFVWSMWGGLGEFEHRTHASPYNDCDIEYWRLRR